MNDTILKKISVSLNAPTFNEAEIQSAIAVLRSGQVTMSQKCFEFEDKFSNHMKSKNAVFVNSGSSANLLAFFALVNPLCPTINDKQKLNIVEFPTIEGQRVAGGTGAPSFQTGLRFIKRFFKEL